MNLFKTMAELQRLQLIRQLQKEDVCEAEPAQAISKACGFEAANRRPPAEKKGDLKKQSQFAPELMGITSFVKRDYENKPAHGTEVNKANLSLSH